jgi:hydroxypyruvate isomerase
VLPPHDIRFAVNTSILFPSVPLISRPWAAHAAGFSAIEMWWPFASPTPSDAELEALVEAVELADVDVVAMNSYAGDMAAGERGIVSDPERGSEFRDNIAVLADLGSRLGCRKFNVLYGNTRDGLATIEQRDTATAELAWAASVVAGNAGSVLVEAISGIDSYPLRRAADAVEVVTAVRAQGVDNVGFLFDTFHLAANGEDLMSVLDVHRDDITHVQIADHPGRGAPGTGMLDMDAVLHRVAMLPHVSCVSLEYLPPSDGSDPFGWIARRDARSAEVPE